MRATDLSALFRARTTTHTGYRWKRHGAARRFEPRAAAVLAELIMRYRCRGQPAKFNSWRRRHNGGPAPTGANREVLEVLIQTAVGLPGKSRSPAHVQAFVAEHLWYFLLLAQRQQQHILVLEGPSFMVDEPGGDGLAIHSTPKRLVFRLWEVKKYSGNRTISRTIGTACKQLDTQALRYLTKFSLLGQQQGELRVRRLFARLTNLWLRASPSAAVGVAVGASSRTIPTQSFGALARRFPRLLKPRRLEGMALGVGNFARFSTMVRDEIWKGL